MLASLIAGLASGETVVALRRARQAAIAWMAAIVAAACGIGFLIGAAYIWASDQYGPLQAAIGFGVFFIAVAVAIILTHKLRARSRARLLARKRSTDMKAIGVATAIAAIPSLLKGKAGVGILAAPVVALGVYALYLRSRSADPDLPPE